MIDIDESKSRAGLPWDLRSGILTNLALRRLKQEFTQHNHVPSEAAWDALKALLACLEESAMGRLTPSVYLSSLDCGVGKTSAIIAFIDALLSRPELSHVGVILCVSRLEEIESFVRRAGVPADQFAVFTSDESLNALGLGKDRAKEARILFSTHSMTERLAKGRSFHDVEQFTFDGKPRLVRIWDESLLFGRGVTVAVRDIPALYRRFSGNHPRVVEVLERVVEDLKAAKDGAVYEVPDLEALSGVSLNDIARVLMDFEEDRRLASTLWFLSNKATTVRKDGKYGNSAIDFEETLPADIKPIIVTDASGRVRSTYRSWESSRGDLVRLPTAPKSYRNLTCRVWRRAGGKTAFSKYERELCEGVAKAINERPGKDILVITHKAKPGLFDVEKTIRGLVDDESRLSFLTWGNHTSVNLYSHCSTVIGAGTLFFRASVIEGLARSAKGLTSRDGKVPYEELREIELGESRHNLLQGAARGTMRRSVGDECAPCELLLIASEASGIPKALGEIFPGCNVENWCPIVREPEGLVKAVIDYLAEWVDCASDGDFLPFKIVQSHVKISDPTSFRRTIREDETFRAAVAEMGLSEGPTKFGGRYPKGWRYFDFAAEFKDESKPKLTPEQVASATAVGDY